MPKITNLSSGKTWTISEAEADEIEKSSLKHLYKIDRVKVPDEVVALRKKLDELPAHVAPVKKKRGGRNKNPQ